MRLTPEQEAAYALDYGVSRADLKPEVRIEYDRLLADWGRLLAERRTGRPAQLARVPAPRRGRIFADLHVLDGEPIYLPRSRWVDTPGFDPGRTARTYARIMLLIVILIAGVFIYMFIAEAVQYHSRLP